jgi:hypothetical protein
MKESPAKRKAAAKTAEAMPVLPPENIFVTVRLRPLGANESERNDRAVWGAVDDRHVGSHADDGSGLVTRFAFDHVFDFAAATEQVYARAAGPLVASAMDGIDGRGLLSFPFPLNLRLLCPLSAQLKLNVYPIQPN